MTAINEDKKTPFAVALANNNTHVLDVLCKQIKLSENPELIHEFSGKIFDDRFKNVLIKLLEKETSAELTADKINVLDKEGFTPFLAFMQSFINQRDELYIAIGRELNYQEYLHKSQTDLYQINNINLFKTKTATDQDYLNHQRTASNLFHIDAVKKQEMQFRFFHTLVVQPFVNFMKIAVEKGADPHATV